MENFGKNSLKFVNGGYFHFRILKNICQWKTALVFHYVKEKNISSFFLNVWGNCLPLRVKDSKEEGVTS